MASYVTLQLDGASLRAVGWRNRNFTEAHLWFRQSLRFKLTLVLPVLMHFLRGALSKYHGVSSAQKDAMLISVWYPLMLVLIWTSAYCSVILKPRDLLLAPPLVLVSYLVCTILGHVHAKGVMFAVALHMARALVQVGVVVCGPWRLRGVGKGGGGRGCGGWEMGSLTRVNLTNLTCIHWSCVCVACVCSTRLAAQRSNVRRRHPASATAPALCTRKHHPHKLVSDRCRMQASWAPARRHRPEEVQAQEAPPIRHAGVGNQACMGPGGGRWGCTRATGG
jgi:hypothetical protein